MNITKGHWQALGACFIWGVFPIYWKFLKHVPSMEILFHRIIWSFAFFTILILLSSRVHFRPTLLLLKKHYLIILSMAGLIGTNWYIYVYAVNAGFILEGSLAYFMTPIMNIVFGAWMFGEKLSPGMKAAAWIAGIGVLVLMLLNYRFPWIALSLAFTFTIYGLLKKKAHVGGLESSFLESSLMFIPALVGAFILRSHNADLVSFSTSDIVLLIGAGAVTATPILLFSLSMRTVPLNHSGVMQFLGPSLQFVIGYFLYNEPVPPAKMTAFVLIWIGVILYIREISRLSSGSRKP